MGSNSRLLNNSETVTKHNNQLKKALAKVLEVRTKSRNKLLELKGEKDTYDPEVAAEAFGECSEVGRRYVCEPKPSKDSKKANEDRESVRTR
eukprot:COSAG05_NODE_402_length_10229_cov_3.609674_5_plen_92_part_00